MAIRVQCAAGSRGSEVKRDQGQRWRTGIRCALICQRLPVLPKGECMERGWRKKGSGRPRQKRDQK